MKQYVIGIDYGTDSCRAVIVDTANGQEIASSVQYYPRWQAGKYCDPAANQYRQHPLDYIETLENVIKDALSKSPAGTAEDSQRFMGQVFLTEYYPNTENNLLYTRMYKKYPMLGKFSERLTDNEI